MSNDDNVVGLCRRLRSPIFGLDYSPTDNIPPHHLNNTDGPEAAALIERQAAQIERLREVLEELIDHAEQCMGRLDYHDELMMGDEPIKEARAALKGED